MAPIALFDLDNTLVDRSSAFRGWAKEFTKDHGMSPSAADWLCLRDADGAPSRHELFESFRQRFNLTITAADLVESYRLEYPCHYRPDPNVIGALEGLRAARWSVAIVTNGPASQVEKIVRAGLVSVVDGWCISEVVGSEKPDPRPFHAAMEFCRASSPSPLWMVGDSPTADIAGGRNVGCRTVWLHRGRRWTVDDYAPDAIADTIVDAVDILLNSPKAVN